MIYSINGERCTSSSRLLIHENIREAFEAKLIARVKNIRVGHALDPTADIGPLINAEHFAKVTSYFDIAKADGAKIAAGGEIMGVADILSAQPFSRKPTKPCALLTRNFWACPHLHPVFHRRRGSANR
jgi:acyl-CoA reductase-like NAD-dependent aldehyde dehydrogenase